MSRETVKYEAKPLRADGSVAGTGYNGALPGFSHCDESTCTLQRRCLRTRHTERSALDFTEGRIAVAFVTHEPCLRCAQDLIARERGMYTSPSPMTALRKRLPGEPS